MKIEELCNDMEDTRERYYCKCPVCGKEFWACKSIFQNWGMLDSGHGSCPQCKTFHNLTLDQENKRMIVTPWNEWVKTKLESEGK